MRIIRPLRDLHPRAPYIGTRMSRVGAGLVPALEHPYAISQSHPTEMPWGKIIRAG